MTRDFFDGESVLQNQADIARAQMALAAAQMMAWAFVAGTATGWLVARFFA